MEYTASELANEIDCSTDTIYRGWLRAGCPHRRDDRGRIWLIGTEVTEWIAEVTRRRSVPLADDEAFCLNPKCRKAVKMLEPITVRPTTAHMEMVTGTCSSCGNPVNRGRARS